MNVQSESGATSYVCLDPGQPVAILKHALVQRDVSYGAGYPAVTVPACPTCQRPMTVANGQPNPTLKLQDQAAYLAAQVVPPVGG